MSWFSKAGSWIKKNAQGICKVAAVAASFIHGVGGVASMALNSFSNKIGKSGLAEAAKDYGGALLKSAEQTIQQKTIENWQPQKMGFMMWVKKNIAIVVIGVGILLLLIYKAFVKKR